MRRIADRSVNIDVAFDEATNRYHVKKELTVTGEFDDEAAAIEWSKQPMDSETPNPSKPATPGGLNDALPVERPIGAGDEMQTPVTPEDDELDLSFDDLDLGGDEDEELPKLPKAEASGLSRTLRLARGFESGEQEHFLPAKVSRVRDQLETLLWDKEYRSVLASWSDTKSDNENLEKVLSSSKIKALASKPETKQLYQNLCNLRSLTNHRESQNLSKQVYAQLYALNNASTTLELDHPQIQAQMANYLTTKYSMNIRQAYNTIHKFFSELEDA